MPPLKKSEKLMLAGIGFSVLVFAIVDPYYFWRTPPSAAPESPAEQKKKGVRGSDGAPSSISGEVRQIERREFDSWGRDPFLQSQMGFEQVKALDSLKLSGISVRGSERYALINSTIVRIGQKIEGFTVKTIERSRVILEAGGKEYALTLGDG